MKNSLIARFIIALFVCLVPLSELIAQAAKPVRPSPQEYITGNVGTADITIKYGSPGVKGRTIWGDLVPYGEIWRAGANEATTFEVGKDVLVEGQRLKAGRYSFYTVPDEQEWTVIFNRLAAQWGTEYEEQEDVLRVKVKPKRSEQMLERLAYALTGKEVVLMWEHLQLPIEVTSIE